MQKFPPLRALGVMSGTSMDGIDVAGLMTDGQTVQERGEGKCFPYEPALQAQLREIITRPQEALNAPLAELTQAVTLAHVEAVKTYMGARKIDLIGFHGQTIAHAPTLKRTRQLFDGALAAKLLNTPVVCDFRSNDMRHGGQGAPLVPIYHQVLAQEMQKPVVFVNLGGVANLTYIDDETLLAFDTGPASALIDDFMLKRRGVAYDENGALAAKGKVHHARVAAAMQHPFFNTLPPKSLDRNAFTLEVSDLSDEDGAATLTHFTIISLLHALEGLPKNVKKLMLCGGGRHNATILKALSAYHCEPAEQADFIEAECFALLAVRRLHGLPISFPTTTGAPHPLTGGEIYRP